MPTIVASPFPMSAQRMAWRSSLSICSAIFSRVY
jgi:hypothetical protein